MLIDSITRLPVELLGEIFYHCSADYPDSPLVLSAVCRTFYDATRASPKIWEWLWLSVSEDASVDRGAAAKTAMWFTMAGACLMNVRVEIPKAYAILDESDILVHSRGAQVPLLSSLLHRHRDRIGSLSLQAYTERQAYSFLDSVYAPFSSTSAASNAWALRKLTLGITSDLLPIAKQKIPAFIPLLSSLDTLKLTSPGFPHLTAANLSNLRALTIIRPIRSHPLTLESIVDVLHSSSVLVQFNLETRLDLPLSSTVPFNSDSTSAVDLIPIPSLTHLSLRTNNNSILLSRLVVPELHTLHLNALDGKRRGRAEETATALGQMLSRMDLPDAAEPCKGGICVLELAGVSICPDPRGPNATWERCFRQMRHLRHISARNMDADHLVKLLCLGVGPGYTCGGGSRWALDSAVCPRLECLVVPFPEGSAAVRTFKAARPRVKVVSLGSNEGPAMGWSNEDELKPKISMAVAAPSNSRVGGFVPSSQSSRPSRVEMKPGASTSTLAPRPPVMVGGFGFGSSFSRMRQMAHTHNLSEASKKEHEDSVNR